MQFFIPFKEPKKFVQRAKFGSRAAVWTALLYSVQYMTRMACAFSPLIF